MTINELQQKCFSDYKRGIKYPEKFTYLYGNPINPVVPIETALGQVMIVGASPSARYYTVDNLQDVPLSDINKPFSTDPYFDGTRVRTNLAGLELEEVILEKLGINREQCWITDLVKVFLFNEQHIKRYQKLGKTDMEENVSHYMDYADRGMKWLRQEIELANPYAIILLGPLVASSLLLISEKEAQKLLTGEVIEKSIIWKDSSFICLPEPEVLTKRTTKNPWPLKFEINIGPRARKEIERLRDRI